MEELLFGQQEAFVLTDAGQRGGDGAVRVARRHAGRLGDVGLLSYRAATDDDVRAPRRAGTPTRRSRGTGTTRRSREDEMRDRLARADVDMWIVEDDGEPVGLPAVVVGGGSAEARRDRRLPRPVARGRGRHAGGRAAARRRPAGAGLGRGDRRPVRVERARGPRAGRRRASSRSRAATRRTRITPRSGCSCGSPARLSAMLLRLTTTLTLCRVRATVAGPHAG